MRLNIQLFAGGTITGTSTASVGRVQIVWTATASDAVANKSSVHADVQVKRSNAYDTTGTFSGTLWINGVATSIKRKFDPLSNQWKTIGGATIDVQHNDDGTKTIEIKTSFSNTGTSMAGTYTASDNVALDTIARASVFNSCSVRVNSSSTLTLYHSITKRNQNFTDKITFCGETFTIPDGSSSTTISRYSTAWNNFYNTMGVDMSYSSYSATLQTYSGDTPVGTASTINNIVGDLNKLDGVDNHTYSVSISDIGKTDLNASAYITSTNADGSTYQSTHSVSDFTTGGYFLRGWSNPRLSTDVSIDTDTPNHYTFGRPITLSGYMNNSFNLDGSSYTAQRELGTSFEPGTYTLQGSDGRKTSTQKSATINSVDWYKPSVNITLTRQSATSQYVDWEITWDYANINTSITPTLTASYTYNNTTYSLSTSGFSGTSGTISGTITLNDSNDYKYPITGNASLVDKIDYHVHSSNYKPAGQPAIYVHKDSSSNNLVDVYGNLKATGHVDGADFRGGSVELSFTTPFIDFHNNNSTADFTSRIIEESAGNITILNSIWARHSSGGEAQVGVQHSSAGSMYMYANGSNHGIWDSRAGGIIALYSDGSKNLQGDWNVEGTIKTSNNGATTTIGDNAWGYCHYETTAGTGHYFNKTLFVNGELFVNGDIYKGSGYNQYVPDLSGYIPDVNAGASGSVDIGWCRICFGKVAINPTANQPTGVWVTFPASFVRNPVAIATPNTAVPYTTVRGCGVSDVGTTGMNVYVTRTNTTQTLVYWFAMGPKW